MKNPTVDSQGPRHTQPTHTPTPWQVEINQYNEHIVTNGEHGIVLSSKTPTIGFEEKNANAAYIVRACNNHENLIKTLKAVREQLHESDQELVDEALAKANE